MLHRIAELEAEVARLQVRAENDASAQADARSEIAALQSGHTLSGFAAAANRREILAGWADLAEGRSEIRQLLEQQASTKALASQTGEALAELEEVYKVMPAGLAVLDGDLRYVRVNEILAQFNGVPAAEHIGRTVREIVPDVAASVEATFRHVFETGEPMDALEFEASTPGSGGETRFWLENARPLKDAEGRSRFVLVSVADITARKRAEQALAKSEARFRAAVQAVSGVIWTISADGRMDGDQPGWAPLTGQSLAQYQGYGWTQAIHSEDAQATLDAWNAAVAEGRTFVFEHRLRCADGRWRHFAVRAIPVVQPHGSVGQWVGVHTDVTEQRAAEDVLNRDKAELERLVEERTVALLREVEERRKAEEALRQGEKMQALGQLTGGIAHDFNNVLQVVASGVSLLGRPALTGERQAVIFDELAKAIENARQLTGRLLAFARKQTLEPQVFGISARLEGMSELLRHTLGSGIRVETDFAPDAWPVFVDPSQLEIAVLNLALNARDAMPQGGTLTLQTRNVFLEDALEREAGGYVFLAVTDTGEGMPPAVLARVFEPFFTTKGANKGTGLGLPQVHGFAKQSGGDIAIQSTPGQGTTVTLHLPRAADGVQQDVPSSPAKDGAAAAMRQAASKTVLVVEDNAIIAAFACSLLNGLGYSTRQAGSAADALRLLQDGEPVDAVFSDVAMPGEIDGLQLAGLLRQRYPRLAVVLTTGYSEALAQWRGKLAAEVVHKPYSQDKLALALERAFARVETDAQAE